MLDGRERLADVLRRIGVEVYPGQWLPEPLVEDEAARHVETAPDKLAHVHAPG